MKRWISVFSLIFFSTQQIWAGFGISPIQLYISDKKQQRSTTIVLSSSKTPESKIFEASAMKWSQNEKGEDTLEPDPNIIINPKNFIIKPESKQIVRIGFSQTPNFSGKEGTWRIIFSEVPPAIREVNTVNFLLNISVPLFVGKQSAVDLKIIPKFDSNNNFFVNVKNKAESHVQILGMTLIDENKKEISVNNDKKYLLTKQENNFKFNQIKSKGIDSYKILIKTDKSEEPLEFKLKE
ncbi:fimbrial biogenesis chaperone [Acinetobacter sp. ANC 4639]